MNRNDSIQSLRQQTKPYDLIVVGGGSTGLGAVVEAAARGHRTLLVEQADFAKGTSSRSTKLVHGGVRYLKQGNVHLVREALQERGRLARNAPHLVHDMAFVIPSYTTFNKGFYGIGLKVYDAMAGKLGLGRSRVLSRDEAIEHLPTVRTDKLKGGVLYHDGQFDDSRLAVNLAQTAVDHGADVVNYMRCTGLLKRGGRVAGVKLEDVLTNEAIEVRGKVVINATGVFVDQLMSLSTGQDSNLVAVSQGIHLVLPRKFHPGTAALMIPKTEDGRVLFAVPWHDVVILGTTDTPVSKAELEPRALREERDFIISHARKYLSSQPTGEDVLSVFVGLRPLVRSGASARTASLSRDHTILVDENGLVTITGGKWTTYRRMGEDVINRAETVAGIQARPCPTREMKIHGWCETRDEDPFLAVYGSQARKVRKLLENPELEQTIHKSLPYRKAEVVWHVHNEMAQSVEDVLARRTRSLILNAQASIEAAPVVARIMASEMGQDLVWAENQVERYTELAKRYIFENPASCLDCKVS